MTLHEPRIRCGPAIVMTCARWRGGRGAAPSSQSLEKELHLRRPTELLRIDSRTMPRRQGTPALMRRRMRLATSSVRGQSGCGLRVEWKEIQWRS